MISYLSFNSSESGNGEEDIFEEYSDTLDFMEEPEEPTRLLPKILMKSDGQGNDNTIKLDLKTLSEMESTLKALK